MEPGFRGHAPVKPLSDFVVGLWSHGHYCQSHASERLLPTGTMTLAVRVDDSGVTVTVAGAHSCSLLLDTSKPFSVIAAAFEPGGGFPFFNLPADELRNTSVPLDLLPGRDSRLLQERLLEADSTPARFRILEAFLLARLSGGAARSPGVRYALNAFGRSCPPPRVACVADRIGWTARRLIARFREEVGLTPKIYSRVARFRQVVASLDGSDNADWADVALSCGYFDQAHFIHDFKEFSGVTPSAYLRERVSANHVRVR